MLACLFGPYGNNIMMRIVCSGKVFYLYEIFGVLFFGFKIWDNNGMLLFRA